MEYPYEFKRDGRTIRGFVEIGYDGRFWLIRDVFTSCKGGKHQRARKATAEHVRKHLYRYRSLDIYAAWRAHKGKAMPAIVSDYMEARA